MKRKYYFLIQVIDVKKPHVRDTIVKGAFITKEIIAYAGKERIAIMNESKNGKDKYQKTGTTIHCSKHNTNKNGCSLLDKETSKGRFEIISFDGKVIRLKPGCSTQSNINKVFNKVNKDRQLAGESCSFQSCKKVFPEYDLDGNEFVPYVDPESGKLLCSLDCRNKYLEILKAVSTRDSAHIPAAFPSRGLSGGISCSF